MPTSPYPAGQRYFDALEEKLFKYLDKHLDEIKEVIRSQGDQVQQLATTTASKNEVGALTHQVNELQARAEVTSQRLRTLETAQDSNEKDRRQRPVQTWQIVVGAFSILAVVWMMTNGFLMFVLQLVSLYLTFHK